MEKAFQIVKWVGFWQLKWTLCCRIISSVCLLSPIYILLARDRTPYFFLCLLHMEGTTKEVALFCSQRLFTRLSWERITFKHGNEGAMVNWYHILVTPEIAWNQGWAEVKLKFFFLRLRNRNSWNSGRFETWNSVRYRSISLFRTSLSALLKAKNEGFFRLETIY